MYTTQQIAAELKKLLAIEYNCTPDDFDRPENIITVAKDLPGRRIYYEQKEFFSMVTLGDNAVISADERIHHFLRRWSQGQRGHWLFEHDNLMELERELQTYGKTLNQSHHMFLPRPETVEVQPDFEVKWFEQPDIMPLYGRKEFSNALCPEFDPNCPDVLAVAAMEGEQIVGLAGCTADTPLWWQVGIEVLPQYRGRGVGTKLVGLLKNEVFRRGSIPFYGTSLSNLGSWRIALNCGFYPAWVEMETKEE